MSDDPGAERPGSGGGLFTRYLRSLDPDGEPPDEKSFDAVWEALRGVLYRELRRRSLWRRSPRYLGIIGWQHWADPGARGVGAGRASDALDELVADCYAFIFVQRIASLRAQLQVKPNVEGLIYLNVGNFIQELQQRHDPLGARVFTILRAVVRESVDDGALYVVEGDAQIGPNTVLAFHPNPLAAADEGTLRPLVEPWSDGLLPDLVTTRGRGQRKLHAQVRALLLALGRQGASAFVFGDLVRLVRREVRGRWSAIFEQTDREEEGVESASDDGAVVVPLVAPDDTFETRQSFRKLVDCVARGLTALHRTEHDERTLGELKAIWDTLVSWAAGDDVLPARSSQDSSARVATSPSRRQIARLLGIPRDRLPGLYDELGRIVRACQKTGNPPGESATDVTSSYPPERI